MNNWLFSLISQQKWWSLTKPFFTTMPEKLCCQKTVQKQKQTKKHQTNKQNKLGYKYSHTGQCQATNMMSLSTELGRNAHNWFLPACSDNPLSLLAWLHSFSYILTVSPQLGKLCRTLTLPISVAIVSPAASTSTHREHPKNSFPKSCSLPCGLETCLCSELVPL